MLEITNLTKCFGAKKALDQVSLAIPDGTVYGLVGSNGAGKSTLLRVLAGVYRADGGSVRFDGEEVFENPSVKERVLFISDYPYFFHGATIRSMARLYSSVYPCWNAEQFKIYQKQFPIDPDLKIAQMSKGMQRQAALILGLSAQPKYLLFDEIFDGLDPVIRELFKQILAGLVKERQVTAILASHNLRELEDICEHIGLLHQGGILLDQNLHELELGILRVQAAFEKPEAIEELQRELEVIRCKARGKYAEFTIRGGKRDVLRQINRKEPLFIEMLPLTLEEVFLSEMEAAGYDIDALIQ